MTTIQEPPIRYAPKATIDETIDSQQEFDLKHRRYYGWYMLPVATVVMVASSPGQTFCITYFNEYLVRELSLTQTGLSTTYMAATLLAALPLPLFGRIVDRFGLRKSTTFTVLFFGLACWGLAATHHILALFASLWALRLLGPGALVLLSNNTLAAWFHRRLGAVSGANSVLMSCGMAAVPWTVLGLTNVLGWRGAYVVMGICVWLLVLPLLLIYRNRPEEVGQRIDGVADAEASMATPDLSLPATGQESNAPTQLNDQGMPLRDAVRQRSFWILIGGTTVWTMVGTAIVFVIVPLFTDRGLSKNQAAFAFTLLTIYQAMTQIVGGLAADKIAIRWILTAALGGMAAATSFLALGNVAAMLPAFAMYGASQGLMSVVAGTTWARYFGRKHLGSIRGVSMTAAVAGSSLGPVLLSVTYDQTGRYVAGMLGLAMLAGVTALLAPWATPPTVCRR